MTQEKPVLILGGGINGAAVARELALNRIPVWVVDVADITSGATAGSSRLIHGGLRYLEYADFRLVRESLVERERLLQLAPQFVRPLKFFVPVQYWASGLLPSAAKFLRSQLATKFRPMPRGLWLVRTGLFLYDKLAKNSRMPKHHVHRVGDSGTPPVDSKRYRWLCSYYDAQMQWPERFVIALLDDAQQLAKENGIDFQVLTYRETRLQGKIVEIRRTDPRSEDQAMATDDPPICVEPGVIINATGAWVDYTLKQLDVSAPQLMGGTKGSHFLTDNWALSAALNRNAIYAEAADGRPVFLLPFGPFSLVGTTDLPIEGDPSTAVTDESELAYLIEAVNIVFPTVGLTRQDVTFFYSGVRPLPFRRSANPASVTRRHVIEEHRDAAVPLISLVGGKLTSCRELAQETAAVVLERLEENVRADSRNRVVPGGADYPPDDAQAAAAQADIAQRLGVTPQQVEAVWQLCGTRAESALRGDNGEPLGDADKQNLPGTELARAFVRRSVRQEWCTCLEDLVERRLMLLYHRGLTDACLRAVAEIMVEEGLVPESDLDAEIHRCRQTLEAKYGRKIPAQCEPHA